MKRQTRGGEDESVQLYTKYSPSDKSDVKLQAARREVAGVLLAPAETLPLPASVGSSTSRACLSACVRVSIPPPTAKEGGTSCQKPAVPYECQLWEKSPRGNVDRYTILASVAAFLAILACRGRPFRSPSVLQPILLV